MLVFLMDNQAFGAWLERKRKERDLSQTELAEMVEVTPGQISRLETGGRGASTELIEKLCRALQAPINEGLQAAGILPQSERKTTLMRVLEHIFNQLPQEEQEELIEEGRLKLRLLEEREARKREQARSRRATGSG